MQPAVCSGKRLYLQNPKFLLSLFRATGLKSCTTLLLDASMDVGILERQVLPALRIETDTTASQEKALQSAPERGLPLLNESVARSRQFGYRRHVYRFVNKFESGSPFDTLCLVGHAVRVPIRTKDVHLAFITLLVTQEIDLQPALWQFFHSVLQAVPDLIHGRPWTTASVQSRNLLTWCPF